MRYDGDMENKIDEIQDLVAGTCNEVGVSATEELLRCCIMAQVLNRLGFESRVRVADAGFDDSDYEGVRLFAYEVDGQVVDLQGRMGWDEIIGGYMEQSGVHSARSWFQVEAIDETATIADEISLCGDAFGATRDTATSMVVATLDAKALECRLPSSIAPSARARRPGL